MRYRLPLQGARRGLWDDATDMARQCYLHMGNSEVHMSVEFVKERLSMHKSCGFPWSRGYEDLPPFASKQQMFDKLGDAKVWSIVQQYHDQLLSPDYQVSEIFTGTGKKELRKLEKILDNKFRAYLAASFRHTSVGIAYFGEMLEKFYAGWEHSPSFVGGSTFHGAWNSLFQRLSKHPHAFEADESSWDATVSEEMVDSVKEILFSFFKRRWQTKPVRQIIDNLFKEMIFSLVLLPNGDLFLKTQGNPSGCFLTIVLNSIALTILFAYSWLRLAPPEMRNFYHFRKHVEIAIVGDDNLYTVSDIAVKFFHVDAIAAIWREVGVVLKPGSVAKGPLVERNFVSQETVLIHGTYLPRPNHDKTISSLLWHTRAEDHVRWSLLKTHALRIQSYWNLETRALLSDYISWLHLNYADELRAPQVRDSKGNRTIQDLYTFEEVMTVYKTDREIACLYYYPEDQSSDVKRALAGLRDLNVPQEIKIPFTFKEQIEGEEEEIFYEERLTEGQEGGLYWPQTSCSAKWS